MSRPRVLVTGAAGFLGRHVCQRLVADGYDVIAHARTDRALAPFVADGLATIACDLESATAADVIARAGRLDAVVHCAGLSSNWGKRSAFASANVDATRALLQAAFRNGAPHFVYVSSSSVCFDFRDQFDFTESQPLPTPVNDYAWSKRAGEDLVRATDNPATTIVRPRGLYGRGDPALLPRLMRAAARGPLPLFRGGETVIDLTHVEDVASAIAAVLHAGQGTHGQTYNVSGGEPLRVRDIIEQAATHAGVAVRWRSVPWPVARGAIRALERFHYAVRPSVEPYVTVYSAGLLAFSQTLDISAIRRDAGWHPTVSFDEGLKRTFAPLTATTDLAS